MVNGRRWVLKNHFSGAPKSSDFELVEEVLPPLQDGEIMFRSLFISVDPYQRPYTARLTVPCTMIGGSVAVVEKSRNKDFPEGTNLVLYAGWVERGIVGNEYLKKQHSTMQGPSRIPAIDDVPLSAMLGGCGMTGRTAYFGLLELCKPKAGETVVVSGAAGAVGSIVGQIAKIQGCKVIGFAGSDEKVNWLKGLGYDYAFNYKKMAVSEALKESAPGGVDCYFDNVGGEMSAAVIKEMKLSGRIAVCGAISHYNEVGEQTKVPDVLQQTISKGLRIEGFLVARWKDRFEEGTRALASWIREGKLKAEETIVNGFENTPQAFFGLFDGSNTGKMVVKV